MHERQDNYRGSEKIITREDIRSFYSNAAISSQDSLCCPTNYREEQLSHIPKKVLEISYGCGSPMGRAGIQNGETVIDLGSGGGIDCFIAAKMVGANGKVYGIDMTEEMLKVARGNADKVAKKLGFRNVEFKMGFLESIPIENVSADLVTSNCVINLSTNKDNVFKEIYRILKVGGRFMISDIIANQPVPQKMRENKELWGECISGAFTLEEFLNTAQKYNFTGLAVRKDYLWKTINEIDFYSFTLQGHKLSFAEEPSRKTLDVVYVGPFSSINLQGSEYTLGVTKKVDENTAKLLSSTPFLDHFNIMDPEKSAPNDADSACCG